MANCLAQTHRCLGTEMNYVVNCPVVKRSGPACPSPTLFNIPPPYIGKYTQRIPICNFTLSPEFTISIYCAASKVIESTWQILPKLANYRLLKICHTKVGFGVIVLYTYNRGSRFIYLQKFFSERNATKQEREYSGQK